MSRRLATGKNSCQHGIRGGDRKRSESEKTAGRRRLGCEPLESRQMLSHVSGWELPAYDLGNTRFVPSAHVASPPSQEFAQKWAAVGTTVLTGDVDGDGSLELVVGDGSNVRVYNGSGALLRTIPGAGTLNILADVNGDGRADIFAADRVGTTLRVRAFDNGGNVLKTYTKAVSNTDTGMSAMALADLNQNGSLELVVGVYSGYSRDQRGVAVFDGATGVELGFNDTGASVRSYALSAAGTPMSVSIGDVTGDGKLEIVRGIGGPANGRVGADGSRDDASYVWCLDPVAGTIWRQGPYHAGGFYDSSTAVADLNGDGSLEVIATATSHGWYPFQGTVGKVMLLDPATGATLADYVHDVAAPVQVEGIADLNSDGSKEILTVREDRVSQHYFVDALNSTPGLTTWKSYDAGPSLTGICAINDLDGDGSVEVVVAAGNRLVVLKNDLTVSAEWTPADGQSILNAIVSDLNGDNVSEIIAAHGSSVSVLSAPVSPRAGISGAMWDDLDGDRVCDPDEPGLAGRTIYLDLNNNGQLDVGEPSTVTSADGSYVFTGLVPGEYTVAEVLQAGEVQTWPAAGQLLQEFSMPSPDAGYDGYGDRFGYPVVPLGRNMVLVGAMQTGGVGAVYLYEAGTGNLLHTFENPAAKVGDNFGSAIATMGDAVLIGSPMSAYGHPAGPGAAYLFTHTGPTWNDWQLAHTFSGSAGANFGSTLMTIGDQFLIGAPGDHPDHLGGAAYLYSGSTYELLQVIPNPSPTAGDRFGTALAASSSTILIGVPEHDSSGSGVVYSYQSNGATWVGPTAFPNPTGNTGELFGDSVALIGGNVLVGAPYDQSAGNQGGAAYLLDGSTGEVLRKFENPHQGVGNPGLGARFGSAVVQIGDDILVSAPWDDGAPCNGTLYLFDGKTYDLVLTLHDDHPITAWPPGNFGHGPAAFGNNILVGDPYADDTGPNSGAAYLLSGPGAGSHRVTVASGQTITGIDFGNHRPSVNLGGPYGGREGDTITLDASGSHDAAGHALTYAWDLDGDGEFDDATGVTADFFAEDDGSYTVRLRVTDSLGAWVVGTAAVTVENAAPEILALVTSAPGVGCIATVGLVEITATFSDPGVFDTHTALIHWGDGTTCAGAVEEIGGAGAITASHAYASGGVYTVTLTVTDDDGGVATQTATAVVSGVGVQGRVLYVVGTDGNDRVSITPYGRSTVAVWADFLPRQPGRQVQYVQAKDFDRIVVVLGDGNDFAAVAPALSLTATFDGGAGDDILEGGGGSNILLGGDGNDMLFGGRRRDVLIGGEGRDCLVGNGDDDILVGGRTNLDADSAKLAGNFGHALLQVLREWNSRGAYLDRIRCIRGGLYGIDDGAADQLHGSEGTDWYFAWLGGPHRDRIPGRTWAEIVDSSR